MNALTGDQSEVARILFSLPESEGFALAGGAALISHQLIERPTRDPDAFTQASQPHARTHQHRPHRRHRRRRRETLRSIFGTHTEHAIV